MSHKVFRKLAQTDASFRAIDVEPRIAPRASNWRSGEDAPFVH
jgi:hypothetical protein